MQNKEGGLLKGLWELPTLTHAMDYEQTFSHFRLALSVEHARAGARFVDPATVALTTATRKILGLAGKPAACASHGNVNEDNDDCSQMTNVTTVHK